MSVVSKWDRDINFWEANTLFKNLGKFKELYNKDKSEGKEESSKIMWAIALFCENSEDNKLIRFPDNERKELIAEDYIGDKDFKWSKYQQYIDFFIRSQYSTAERSLYIIRKKMEERDSFLNTVSYSMDNATEMDRIISNTDKLFSLLKKLEEEVLKEKSKGGNTKGGAKESASDRKLL